MMRSILTVTAVSIISFSALGQATGQQRAQQVQLNTITTAVPFLQISPDSRSGAMGDAGVALSPDENSIHWNPAKMAFYDADFGVSLSYSPWLRAIVPDMNLAYLTGVKKLNKNSAVGASLRYFSLGEITFTEDGTTFRPFKPNEFALDVAYALKLNERLSTGVALRYVRSNLTGGTVIQGAETKAGQSIAFDVSAYYRSKAFKLSGKNAYLNLGLNLSNVGSKMNYSTSTDPDFIPTTLRLGPALQVDIDEFNSVNFTVEASKLLVPTPPVYLKNADGSEFVDPVSGKKTVVSGKDPNVSPVQGIAQSFNDAPGGGKEELREFNIATGLEYLYNKQIAVRAGYFYEHPTKGNRQFISMGAGLKYQVLNIDLSYLISTTQANPLANTLRITLRLGFNKSKEEVNEDSEIDG